MASPYVGAAVASAVMAGRTWTIVGVGGVGGYYGSRLALAGHRVRWVARSDVAELRDGGLRVESPDGDAHLADLEVYRSGDPVPPSDVVVLCTKALDGAAAAAALVPAVGPESIVVVLQNGLGVEAPVAAAFPGHAVLGAMSFICAQKAGPAHVRHLDYSKVTVGAWTADGGAAGVTDEVAAVCSDLAGSGVPVEALDDLAVGRWRKLVWNVPFNGLSVVLDADTAEMVGDPSCRGLVRSLMDEVIAGARACGHDLGPELVDSMIASTERMVPYAPSMKLDHDAGRPMELDVIYDRPIAAAAEVGCPMPATEVLLAQLRFLEHRRRTGG
jgi:2-dehydropantoate 2-reductase